VLKRSVDLIDKKESDGRRRRARSSSCVSERVSIKNDWVRANFKFTKSILIKIMTSNSPIAPMLNVD